MNKGFIAGAVAVAAVFAGVVYFAGRSDAPESTVANAAKSAVKEKTPATANAAQGPQVTSRADASGRPAPVDPRLAALMVSPDNGVIEFVKGGDGRVIREIDQDPNSLGYKKPLREYVYSGDKIVGLTTYRYHADQVEVVRTAVSYKPDGSVDQYREETSFQPKK
jgi:hypothetical protein